MKTHISYIVFIAVYCFFLPSISYSKEYKIGFSQCTTSDLWRQTQIRNMEIEMSSYPEMELIIKDANNNTSIQIQQIESFLNEGIDLLIVSPNESKPIAAVVEKVFQKGIPVIILDRKVETESYTSYVGGDNFFIGVEAGNYAAKLLNGKGRIFEIRGLDGSSPARERHDGFLSVLNGYEDIEIVKSVPGDWKGEKANEIIKTELDNKVKFDLVFAHNDVMAKEVYSVLQQNRDYKNVYILGVDGLPGNEGGIQMVLDNILDATFLYQNGGSMAIQIANEILNNHRVSKLNIIPTIAVDMNNAPMLKSQTDQIEILHNKIERQKLLLTLEVSRNRIQKLILFFLIAVVTLSIALAILIYFSLRNKKKANLALTENNLEIEKQNQILKEQHEKLLKIGKELEEATQTKLIFFTNISHEFKTPLTLIKGPVEFLMGNEKSTENKKMFEIIYRNTVRLQTMIDQLMDFRRLENKKLNIKASENDLKKFIQKIYDSFKMLAESRKIDFNIISNLSVKTLWFDCDKMETVMYNLLSNSFKYTQEGGKITISLTQDKVDFPGLISEEVCISVIDNGVGIPATDLNKIFERFFQNGQSKIAKGAGIGLNFSKELVELHRGRITVSSNEGIGTTFCVFLPIGNLHLLEDEITRQNTCELLTVNEFPLVNVPGVKDKVIDKPFNISENAPLILIVEDIPDVADFIKVSLDDDFRIVLAQNGKEGILKVMEEEPDLIISDVMMPEMDGFTFTKTLKSQVETSHIPIILLTAKSTIEDKIEGIGGGADCFIDKPFNCNFLKTSILNLLKSRERLREHYRNNLDFNSKEMDLTQLDKKFLDTLKKNILQNIGKEDFNIDELSHMIGISRVQLYRKVKKLTDMSVSEFVISIKLQNSLEYLRKSGKTVTEVAYESGFSSQSYYTRCFKEQFKISPSEYIKRYRS